VLYLGDLDLAGGRIETNTRTVLTVETEALASCGRSSLLPEPLSRVQERAEHQRRRIASRILPAMPDMTTLWPVIVGGVIGLVGGFGSATLVHLLQAKQAKKRRREEKFQDLIVAILETQTWLDSVRNSKFWGKEEPTGLPPISKAYAIATIYFPHLVTKINELNDATQEHVKWIAQAAMKKLENPTGFANDLPATYRPWIAKMNETIGELNRTARREFGTL
jgi:hypothetical protein